MTIVLFSFEFNLFLVLSLISLTTKCICLIVLGIKIYKRKKEAGKLQYDFLFAVFILLLVMFVGRILYVTFDFFLVQFDTNLYHLFPNYIIWKLASFIISVGGAINLFIIDKEIIDFKLKGVLSYFSLGAGILILVIPVKNAQDFLFISDINIIASSLLVAIPLIFLYVGIKTPKLRRISFLLAFGAIIYLLASVFNSPPIVNPLIETFGEIANISRYFIHMFLKVIAFFCLTYGGYKFTVG